MNKTAKHQGMGKKRKTESLQQKIDAAQKKKARLRASSTLPPVTVSPAGEMTAAYTAVGMLFRAVVLFMGICGLTLFFSDAAKLVLLNNARADSIVVDASFVALWSAVIAVVMMALSLHRYARIASPFVLAGGIAAYLFASYSDPIGFVKEAFRRLFDLVLSNMAEAGYTTYMQYITEEPYSYNEELLVRFAVASIVVVTGIVLGYAMARRVRAVPVAIVCAVYMVPVFMFNLTRTNKGLAMVLVFLCGTIALYLFDGIYGGVFDTRKAKKTAKKERKAAKKAAKKAQKAEKLSLRNAAAAAYNAAIEGGMPRSAAKKARAAVFAKAKKDKENAARAEAARVKHEKQQKLEAKRAAKEEKRAARAAKKEEAKKMRARSAAVRKSRNPEEAASLKQARADAKSAARAARKAAGAERAAKTKTVAASGYAGAMAMVIAFLAICIPLAAVKKNFPIVDIINNKMQLVRTYVTAYLMGDDVDLNSLAMYGGVAELNPRNVTFDTPQYTGQKLFSVESGYAAPVYMRSWIGTDYDLENDLWTSADADEVIAYRERFGSSYTPDNITYFFNKYVYPTALEVNKVDQYRNLDDYGFRVFQVHVRRVSGTSKILFVPSVMNAGLGIMDFGSIEHTEKKYSAYYDGIYSSRFFGEGTSYSTSTFNPVLKAEGLAENLEGSIAYYNLAKDYADTIDIITAEIAGNLLFDENREYTYETPLGEIKLTGSDLSFLLERFDADVAELGYKYKSQSFVELYLAMTSAERKTFQNSYDKELNYRDYAEETYTATFGSEAIASLADEILAEAGLVQGEKYVHDKSAQETMTETQLKRLTAEERYGNEYGSWFTDTEGNVVPRHEAIMAVINYLRYNYEYTLDPVCEQEELLDEDGNVVLDEEGNPVMVDKIASETNLEAFLFEVKQGYCVHFATSAVALLRELGFAVRYDEGYIAANWNRTYDPEAVSTYRTSVRDYDAHSWIEVYYPAIGWVTYECTPSYCEEMYDLEDLNSSSTGSSGIDQSKVTVRDNTIPPEEITVDLGVEEEVDYTALFAAIGVVLVLLLALLVIWAILKARAGRAMEKRRKLIAEAKDERRFYDGETDLHHAAREITDCVFAIFDALGCPHETGELPTEYALRLDADYGNLSKHRIVDVMSLIEKEEFGGTLTFRELCVLAEYLSEILGSVYAGLPAMQKLRMRYFMNVI
ncbi:MAG: transglutaminase domain-containing protein [Eubacteriales bacterium]